MHECMNLRTNERMKERMIELMNERTNGQMNTIIQIHEVYRQMH